MPDRVDEAPAEAPTPPLGPSRSPPAGSWPRGDRPAAYRGDGLGESNEADDLAAQALGGGPITQSPRFIERLIGMRQGEHVREDERAAEGRDLTDPLIPTVMGWAEL